MPEIEIKTSRFILKELTLKDATPRYLEWLTDDTAERFIISAKETQKLSELKDYIHQRVLDKNCLFLGIYTLSDNEHIGNIKYEPINQSLREATMGILIGETKWRGKGVAKEVILASAEYLNNNLNISKVILGVESDNFPAITAYEKMGFKRYKDSGSKGFFMKYVM